MEAGDQQALPFDGLEQGEGDAAVLGQRLDGEPPLACAPVAARCGLGAHRRHQGFVGRVQLAVEEAADHRQAVAPALQPPDLGQALEVAVVIEGHPPRAGGRGEEVAGLVVAHRVDGDVGTSGQLLDPIGHATTLGVVARNVESGVVAEDDLGDADRLVAALELVDHAHGDLHAAGDVLDARQAWRPRRSFEPTGTGAGKRTLLSP